MSVHNWWFANLTVLLIGLNTSVVTHTQLNAYERRFEAYEEYVEQLHQSLVVHVRQQGELCLTLSRLSRACIDRHREMCQPPRPRSPLSP